MKRCFWLNRHAVLCSSYEFIMSKKWHIHIISPLRLISRMISHILHFLKLNGVPHFTLKTFKIVDFKYIEIFYKKKKKSAVSFVVFIWSGQHSGLVCILVSISLLWVDDEYYLMIFLITGDRGTFGTGSHLQTCFSSQTFRQMVPIPQLEDDT